MTTKKPLHILTVKVMKTYLRDNLIFVDPYIVDDSIEIPTRCSFVINSVALVRERTIPTERPPPVGEVSANFCG